MTLELTERTRAERLRVLIAGGGVAALEAMLTLSELAGGRVQMELIAPNDEFVYQALAVAAPFGAAEPRRVRVELVARDAGAIHRRNSLVAVDAERREVRLETGESIPFDALLVAIGADRVPDLPGAFTYRGAMDNRDFSEVIHEAEAGRIERLAFAVPGSVWWPLAIYDLALLTASHLSRRGAATRVLLVTHEARPLGLFGRRASDRVLQLLEDAGVELHLSRALRSAADGALELEKGRPIEADRVVALPRLQVSNIPGLPQGKDGYIGTDRHMRVEEVTRVYSAGDATWFPIKQGGIAAQQAESAASVIASIVDDGIRPKPFRPLLRGALLTGGSPLFMRARPGARRAGASPSDEPLWWPPEKVAAPRLAPYLRGDGRDSPPLEDLPDPGPGRERDVSDHRDSLELALSGADASATTGDYRGALRWLQVAEDLQVALPHEYVERRRRWEAELEKERLAHQKGGSATGQ